MRVVREKGAPLREKLVRSCFVSFGIPFLRGVCRVRVVREKGALPHKKLVRSCFVIFGIPFPRGVCRVRVVREKGAPPREKLVRSGFRRCTPDTGQQKHPEVCSSGCTFLKGRHRRNEGNTEVK